MLFILISLIITFSIYLFYIKFDYITEKLDDIISKIRVDSIAIPENNEYKLNYDFKSFDETYDFKPKNVQDIKNIYYTVLNNGWKEFTFYCTKDYPNCAKDVKSIADDNDFITLINNYVHPYNSFKKYNTIIYGEKEVYLSVDPLYSDSEINEAEAKIESVFKNLNIDKTNPTLSDIKNIHDFIIKNTVYDNNYKGKDVGYMSNKVNGALIYNKALCSGYSDSFAIMINKLNIPNFKIATENHVWNAIYFNNKWSHIDVTWDDDETNPSNHYNFFMINTNKLLSLDVKEHKFNNDLYLEMK